MGIWWKKIDDFPDDESGIGITLKGDPKAWPKHKMSPLWRFIQRWQILRVNTTSPYYLYFSDGKVHMVFRSMIREKQIAVRVGTEDLSFVALDVGTGIPLEIVKADFRRWTYKEIHNLKQDNPTLEAYGLATIGEFKLV